MTADPFLDRPVRSTLSWRRPSSVGHHNDSSSSNPRLFEMPPEPPESPHEGPEPEEREWSILSLTELWRDPLAHQGDPRISAVGGWLEPSDGEWVTVTNVDRSVMHSFRVFEVRCMSLYSQEQIPSFDKSGDGLVYYHLFLD